jgi:hypothetical protein
MATRKLSSDLEQYVVIRGTDPTPSVRSVLADYPQSVILDELDPSTLLVEMPRDVSQRLAREHPTLLIEPNLRYKLTHE